MCSISIISYAYYTPAVKGDRFCEKCYRIGMGLFHNPFGDDGHFAVYVGNYFPGYENAVIESVYGGVIIRELSESEAINDPFTHYGYMKGIDYTN